MENQHILVQIDGYIIQVQTNFLLLKSHLKIKIEIVQETKVVKKFKSDRINVSAYANKEFNVEMYKMDTPRYIPYV